MTRIAKRLKWFGPYERLGYTIEGGGGRHYKVRDPEGVLVTVISCTPSDRNGMKDSRAYVERHERERQS